MLILEGIWDIYIRIEPVAVFIAVNGRLYLKTAMVGNKMLWCESLSAFCPYLSIDLSAFLEIQLSPTAGAYFDHWYIGHNLCSFFY